MNAVATVFSRGYYRKVFLSTFIIVSSGALCLGLGFVAFFPLGLAEGYGTALTAIHKLQSNLAGKVVGLFAMATFILVSTIVFFHVFFSHRIAGPVFRIGREAELIGKGNIKAAFNLRKGDHLAEVAESLKKTASRYREMIDALERNVDAVASGAASLSSARDKASTDGQIEDMKRALKSIDALLAEIKTC